MSRWKPDAAGRLVKAALDLFDRQGYEDTTVADIAASAGLTKRTFFRHFSDKREVLFSGSEELERLWVSAVRDAPDDAGALAAVEAGLGAVADMFTERHAFAQVRARVVAANPELQERELIKLERLASSVAAALEERGVKPSAAELAGQTGVRVFHLAFARWIAQEDPAAFYPLIKESLGQLRELLTN
ncbi:MAG TPA: helix-turn-helix domain-containing protein [Acidimicrobiales bacterium]|nr:helix-turn-helix domain-containing protein [Acidimicrobiales bacterium]